MFNEKNESCSIKSQIEESRKIAISLLREVAFPRDIKTAQIVKTLDLSVTGKGEFEPVIAWIKGKYLLLMFQKEKLEKEKVRKGFHNFHTANIRNMLICEDYRRLYDILLEHYEEDLHLLFRCQVNHTAHLRRKASIYYEAEIDTKEM